MYFLIIISSISVLLSSCAYVYPSKKVTKQTVHQIESRDVPKDWVYLEPVPHIHRHKLRSLDTLVRGAKEDYFNECLDWVRVEGIPEKECEYYLLDKIERRFGLTDDPKKVLRVADEIFFADLEPKILAKLSEDDDLRLEASKIFRKKQDLLDYYRKIYSFQVTSKELDSGMKLKIKAFGDRKEVEEE